jgi:hypothetical protein
MHPLILVFGGRIVGSGCVHLSRPLLINKYSNNFVCIAWGGEMSDYFTAVNRVKQGDVLSHILYCVCNGDLLLALFYSGVGCYVVTTFVGLLVYADDIVLIATNPTALCELTSTCGGYTSVLSNPTVYSCMASKTS